MSAAHNKGPVISFRTGLALPGLMMLIFFLGMIFRPAMSDPDYYWHLETGRLIIEQLALPDSDPFSFTKAGQDWVLHEWLFEAVLYLVYSIAGAHGIVLFCAFLGTAVLGAVYAAAKMISGRSGMALCLAGLVFPFIFIAATPRPQLMTYIFLSLFFYILCALKYRGTAKLLPVLPLMMIVWVNAHGGYLIGLVMLAVFWCAWRLQEWVVQKADNTRALPDGLNRLGLMIILCILASLCNPYFVSHWAYPFAVMDLAATQQITEWQSPDFHGLFGMMYLVLVAGFSALQIYRAKTPGLVELAVPGLLIVAGFVSTRHIVLAAIAMAIFAAPAIVDGIRMSPALRVLADRLCTKWRSRPQQGKELGRAEGYINLAMALVLSVAASVFYPVAQANASKNLQAYLPVEATQFITEHGISGRIFNTYHFGGYLIHRLYPDQRVFIDGRADLYGDDFYIEYSRIHGGQPGWEDLFDKHRIDIVICVPGAPIRQLLIQRGDFQLAYSDDTSVVLLKKALAESIAD